ncbi:MAG: 23S rRNA (adenine(2503)-C(2))-methyltransferase RlmN [Desulfobacteraceae bacterium]
MKTDLKGLDASQTEAWAAQLGLEPYRGRQIRHWLMNRLARSFDEMTNIPKTLRDQLKASVHLNPLTLVKTEHSRDTTRKYLFKLRDGHFIESVLIPERDHFTLCISSQAGCAMGCRFCATGRQGLQRNLKASEIIEQAIWIKRDMAHPQQLTNVVLMGMGEPLANYEAVLTAVKNLISEDGLNLSHRRVTLSTSGLAPQMERLGRDVTINLAVSLNAADDKTRSFLMPVNQTYPLNLLMDACRRFPLPNRRMLTFEYILINGINDRDRDAYNLMALIGGMRAKINLIPFNPFPGSELSAPSMDRVLGFQNRLMENHFTTIVRKSKGQDISAACGQLSGTLDKDQRHEPLGPPGPRT